MAKTTCVSRELLYTIEDSHCTFLIIDEQTAPNVKGLIMPPSLKELFAVGSVPGFINALKFQELSDASFKPHVPIDTEQEVVVVLYTSGSTGLPKGVEISHRAYCAAFLAFRSTGICTKEDVFLAWNPLTHVSGFAIGMFCMFLGAKIVITDSSIPCKDFLDTLRTFQVSLFVGIAGRIQDIVNEVKKNKEDVSRVKQIIVGGAVITKSLSEDIHEIFNVESLINSYGLTETFAFLSISRRGQITFDNNGFPIAGSKVQVIDLTSGEPVDAYQTGEIVVQSRSAMKSYFGRPEATAEALSSDGWLRTGDLGYYDLEGQIHIVDRLKQMIKCMGNVVTPAELENILMSHEDVAEAVVVGVPSFKYGEAPAACVVVNDGCERNLESLAEELKALIAGQAAAFKQLYGGVFFMKCLPKCINGKIMRQDIKKKISNIKKEMQN
ncbi:4-coumarate--CoA ligase 1 [Ixodes scapularis]